MNVLIAICGRAGSKGVNNKNFKKLLGYPLVDYTVAAAKLFQEKNQKLDVDICINSDSKKLLKIATRNVKIDKIKRPERLAQDDSPKVPAIRYSLKEMEDRYNLKYDYVIDLDITAPLRKIEDMENALKKSIAKEDVDVVYSVVEARRNPYFNMVERVNGEIKRINKTNFIRRQDAPDVYDMNASIYCYKRNSLLQKLERSTFDGKSDIIIMKDTGVLDIDSEEDFRLMDVMGKYFFEEEFKEIKDKVILNNN